MPELPEVQTIVSDLAKKIVGLSIKKVWIGVPKLVKKPEVSQFAKEIVGLKIKAVVRRGKNILITLARKPGEEFLFLIHLKMTGHLLYGRWIFGRDKNIKSALPGKFNDPQNQYIRVVFYFNNGKEMAFSDLRKFGKFVFGKKDEVERSERIPELGPEPLERQFSFKNFKTIIAGRKRNIKQVLMDQEIIAGIGNIYSDEILWRAKIDPLRKTDSLSDNEIKNIFSSVKKVLKEAVRLRGTSVSDYRDTAGRAGRYGEVLAVYGREGQKCPRCGAPIRRVKIGGRSAHFCPKCQS